ncbi:HTH-type transcriptional repressor KstR2 [Rhodobacteraceae bacterium THAF1]|uniref:TetR/AcrR family transcriptional regulator n=1 Tax=Palleronia sp. THAF1 TaxID=2587842 RepID=UPI000F3FF4B1|nr:TetR/AcrR family transcriptional regulator [Palleronia sp. THAF1]QFU08764.1 HTH-type transcriptional repressor KstR2 [Palleronia sp. THAF1]VDC31238.1 HTH-type transcriptional repressor KstR2 [Rhodobacteraceae bacterium THAF1]
MSKTADTQPSQETEARGTSAPRGRPPRRQRTVRGANEGPKRERILDTAARLFHERGYAKTTLDQVAEEMGFSKALIYANFRSKTELLVAICEMGIAEVHKAVKGALDLGLDTRTTLALVVERYVTTVLKYQRYIAVHTREDKALPAEDAYRVNEARRAFFHMLAAFLERGRDEGTLSTSDPLLSALELGGSVTWMAFWFVEGGRLEPHEIAAHVTRSTLMMLGAAERPDGT